MQTPCRGGHRGVQTQAPSRRQRSFAKMHMYCIALADRPCESWKRSTWKCTFLKTGLRVEKSENVALPLSCGRRIRILSKMMTLSPHPATSHNNNNNNGGLHARVRATEDIEPFLQLTCLALSQQQFNLINGPHKRFWFPCTSHLLLGVFGFSVYCLFTARKLNAHAPCLLLCFWWMSSATYRLEYEPQRFRSFSVNPCGCKHSWNDAEEDGEKMSVFARLDGPSETRGHWPLLAPPRTAPGGNLVFPVMESNSSASNLRYLLFTLVFPTPSHLREK